MAPSPGERVEKAVGRLARPALAALLRLVSHNVLAKAISIIAAVSLFVLLRVNTLDQRFFSVPLQFQLPPGYALASVTPQSARLTLRGEQELIFSLSEEEFSAVVDLRPFAAEGEHEAPVEVLVEGRAAAVQRLEVSSDPDATAVVLEQAARKSVRVRPVIVGSVARGHELTAFTIIPSEVEVAGPRGAVERLEDVSTEEIELRGRDGNFITRVRIAPVDPLLTLPGGAIAEFRAVVTEQRVDRDLAGVAVRIVNLADGLVITAGVQPVTITVAGPRIAVEELRPAAVALTVDLAEVVQEGTYTVVPQATVPEPLTVVDLFPANLELAVTEGEAR